MFNGLKRTINRWLSTDGSGPGLGYAYTSGPGGPRASLLGLQSSAGPLINEQTAMTIPAFLHAMRLSFVPRATGQTSQIPAVQSSATNFQPGPEAGKREGIGPLFAAQSIGKGTPLAGFQWDWAAKSGPTPLGRGSGRSPDASSAHATRWLLT